MTLYEYLTAHGLTQREFASRLGVEPITVARWIKGQRFPRRDMLGEIMRATEGRVRPDSFFRREEASP